MTAGHATVYPDEPAGPFDAPPRTITDDEGREVRLAAADAGDLEAVVEMYVEFDPADRAQGIPPAGESEIREWAEDILSEGYDAVARHRDSVVGHATLVPDGKGAFELAIFVLGEYQGAGIGTALLKALLGHGREAGAERVWLSVEPWNHAAISVYETVGFEPCGTGTFERRYSIRL